MRALAVLVALTIALPARAQDASDDETRHPMHFELGDLRKQYGAAQKRRNVGLVLAAPGVAMCVLGGLLIGYGGNDRNLLSAGDLITSGIVVTSVGLTFTIPGLVLWVQGQERMDKTTWRWRQEGEYGNPR